MNSLLPLGLLVCLAAGAALWWWPSDDEATDPATALVPAAASSDSSPPPGEAPVLNARWTAPKAVQNPDREAKRRMMKLPTGEYVQALNGAIDAKPLEWPQDRPYSPIIGTERAPDGTEWWVHADGSKSTTTMTYRSDLGRHDCITQLASPTPALPMEPEEFSRPRETPAGGAKGGAGGKDPNRLDGSQSEIKKQ